MTIGYQVGLGARARELLLVDAVRIGASGFLRTLDFGTSAVLAATPPTRSVVGALRISPVSVDAVQRARCE
jgi:hypothetical protein